MKHSIPIIDTDVHCQMSAQAVERHLAQPWRKRWAGGNRGPGHLGYHNPVGVMRSDAVLPDGTRAESSVKALAQAYLDPFGIEYAILNEASSLNQCVAVEPDYAAAVCSAMNDEHLENWMGIDPRCRFGLIIPAVDPTLSAKEIRRVGGHPEFAQVYMSSATRVPLGQRYHWPIYEAACEMGLPVAIHPGMEGVGVSFPPAGGYPSRYLEWHTVLACSYISNLVSLLTEGVFQQFPTLRFVLIEGGVSWLPPVLWRLDKNWKALRDQAPWLDRLPSEVAAEHVYLTTQPIEEPREREHLHQVLRMFPAERMLMFSSDYPHWDGDTPEYVLKWMPEELKRPVMCDVARKLYDLPVRSEAEAARA